MEKEREKVVNENDNTLDKSLVFLQHKNDSSKPLGTKDNIKIDKVKDDVQNDTKVAKQKQKRTKTGCFGCRVRRKKCDEVHPICSGCKSSKTECVWPQSGKAVLTKHMRDELSKKTIKKRMKREGQLHSDNTRENQNQTKGINDVLKKRKTMSSTTLLANEKIPLQFEPALGINNKTGVTTQMDVSGNASFPGMANKPNKSKSDMPTNTAKQKVAFVNYTTAGSKKNNLGTKKTFPKKITDKRQKSTINTPGKQENIDDTSENPIPNVENMAVPNKDFANYLFNPTNINESSNFLDKMLDLGIQNGFLMTTFLNNNTEIPMDFLSAPGTFENSLPSNDISFSLSHNQNLPPQQQNNNNNTTITGDKQ
ncbi:hypothetical protein ACO0QE_004311 [Hanseniaspora vineae]